MLCRSPTLPTCSPESSTNRSGNQPTTRKVYKRKLPQHPPQSTSPGMTDILVCPSQPVNHVHYVYPSDLSDPSDPSALKNPSATDSPSHKLFPPKIPFQWRGGRRSMPGWFRTPRISNRQSPHCPRTRYGRDGARPSPERKHKFGVIVFRGGAVSVSCLRTPALINKGSRPIGTPISRLAPGVWLIQECREV